MKSLDISEHLIANYLSLLKNLNNRSKLELISALSLSMKHEQQQQGELAQASFGAFKTHQSAEQLLEDLRQARYFNRPVEKL